MGPNRGGGRGPGRERERERSKSCGQAGKNSPAEGAVDTNVRRERGRWTCGTEGRPVLLQYQKSGNQRDKMQM